jgi:hypothetical protein
MSQTTSMGKCLLCKGSFNRAAMTRHLKTCGLPSPKAEKQTLNQSLHLFVEARYSTAYWMHLAVPGAAQLSTVDNFLRRIWLECCGHLSAFTIQGTRYSSSPMSDDDELGMGKRLGVVLEPGMSCFYEYDYGSTTELKLKVVGLREQATKKSGVQLLARNDAPIVACDQCGNHPAIQICTECAWEDKGWLCEACAADHECGEDMFMPVVNSPRVGVCGYTG